MNPTRLKRIILNLIDYLWKMVQPFCELCAVSCGGNHCTVILNNKFKLIPLNLL